MTVRVCPICDIADCATHRPSAALSPQLATTAARARALRLDQLARHTLTPTKANFHRTTAELLRDLALKLETQNDCPAPPNPSGFDAAMKSRCRETCAEFGDPPCWKLPELVQPCEQITPCDECRNGIGEAE